MSLSPPLTGVAPLVIRVLGINLFLTRKMLNKDDIFDDS